jgi:hypothetical protein
MHCERGDCLPREGPRAMLNKMGAVLFAPLPTAYMGRFFHGGPLKPARLAPK